MAGWVTRNRWFVPVVMVVIAATYIGFHSRGPASIGDAFISEKAVTLWSSTAEVREPAGVVHYGEHVTLMARNGTLSEVRTGSGSTGWLDSVDLMDPALWQQSVALLARAKAMPVQARGHTKTLTNVHVLPGRDASHIFQLSRDVPVLVLARAVASPPAPPGAIPSAGTPPAAPAAIADQTSKLEDWLLIMPSFSPQEISGENGVAANSGPGGTAQTAAPTDVAGWVLARFIEYDTPGPVHDYALSSDLRVVAWAELNRVWNDSAEMPQYVVAGVRGPEGQACDFTLLRVYTWGEKRKEYETAYVEGNLCGKLPIRVSQTPDGPEFRFAQAESTEQRVYVMHQTAVRRIDEVKKPPVPRQPKRNPAPKPKPH
jgi:hypothetical protein